MQQSATDPDAVASALAGSGSLVPSGSRVAVLIPCYNEALTIRDVIEGFRRVLPQARIYVYDNNSRDDTSRIAREAGVVVRTEERQGKGNVVRRMFSDIDADCYVMVDGDDTYDALAAASGVALVTVEGYDFVNIARVTTITEAYRRGHKFGNVMLTGIVRAFFGRQTSDMLSGYKVLSRRFVKSFPAMSRGFETETELTVHALEMRMPMAEFPAPYKERPEGSTSKLRTYRDGWRILMLISRLIKDERPLAFFAWLGCLFTIAGLALGLPIVVEYFQTGFVPRIPTAILSVGFVVLAALSMFAGLILDVVTKARQELKRLSYLSQPNP